MSDKNLTDDSKITNTKITNTQITIGTITRTILLIIALVNQVLTVMGKSIIKVSDEEVSIFISTGFTIVTAIAAWWKNNSFTSEACLGDAIMCTEKQCRKQSKKQNKQINDSTANKEEFISDKINTDNINTDKGDDVNG